MTTATIPINPPLEYVRMLAMNKHVKNLIKMYKNVRIGHGYNIQENVFLGSPSREYLDKDRIPLAQKQR
jgi:hypothetical protein